MLDPSRSIGPGLICPLLLSAFCVTGASADAGAAEMSEVLLPSGMRVVLRPVRTTPVVCSAVLVRAGVAWETDELSGASHFLEHLLFNGTTTRTQDQLYADVDRIGAYNNATTRADHTMYLLLAPKEHLEAALEIQADMLLRSTLPADKFEKEKGIVLEEMGRDVGDPAHLADTFFASRMYAGSPYARPVLGSVDSIRGLSREAVLAYYKDRYVPRRMVLILAGDFDPDEALTIVRQWFGFPGEEAKAEAVAPDRSMPRATIRYETEPEAAHSVLEAGRTYLRAAFPGPAEGDPDAVAFGLLAQLLDGGSSPLDRVLTGGDDPVVYDYSLHHDTTGGSGSLVFSATLTGARSPEEVVRTALDTMIRSVRERSLDPEDLRLLREADLTEAATLAEQVHYWALFRAPRFLQATVSQAQEEDARGEALGVEAFDRLVGRYLLPPRAVVTVSGPDEEEGTSTRIDLSGVGQTIALPEATAETLVLQNGLTLSVSTEPGAPVFGAHLIARNRSALEPEGRDGLADLVHHMLLRGTLARDAGGLDDELRGRGLNLKLHDDPRFPFDDYRTVPTYSFVMLETRAERSMEALRLLAEIIQTPRFDEEEIVRTTAQLQDIAGRKGESSSAVSEQLFRSLVAPDHPYSRPVYGSFESFEGLDRDEVVEMGARLFAPENLILTIRGSGSRESVLRRAKEIFGGPGPGGGWAASTEEEREARRPTELVAAPRATEKAVRDEREMNQRQSYLRLGAVIDVEETEHPALEAAILLLSHRLQMDLRERQGLAYSIGSSLSPLGGGRQLIEVSMGTAADNLERAEEEIRRVAAELLEGPVPTDELERIVAARKGRILMRRLPRQNQAYYDGLRLLFGAPTGGDLDFLEALGRVTPEQVLQAARRYMKSDGWAVAIAR